MRETTRRILLILGLSLLLALGCAFASADGNHTIADNGEWSGMLTNLDMSQIRMNKHAELDWENPMWTAPFPVDFIKIPQIKAGIQLTLGASGEFDITISQANLKENQNIDSTIRYNEDGIMLPGKKMYRERIDKGNVFDDLPTELVFGLGVNAGIHFVAAASQPVRVQGRFTYKTTLELSVEGNGFTTGTEQEFEFTSIKPLNPVKDQRIVVFVGSQYEFQGELININTSAVKIGPILELEADVMGGGIAEGVVHKDEMEFERYADWDTEVIHSCTENGREGCLEGEVRLVSSDYVYAGVNLKASIPAIDKSIDILEKHYPLKTSYFRDSKKHFVQSLTWREKLKKQEYCSHLYYKVPVAVWANQGKTIPISGIYVHQQGVSREDANMTPYTVAWTGKNPKIQPRDGNEKGKAVLYLPYIDGKYTIVVDSLNNEQDGDNDKRLMGGSAEQPEKMRRGANEQVDIILESSEKTEYRVEKKWDIDLEGKDRPDSIDVLLQTRYGKGNFFSWEGVAIATLNEGNNWSYTFTNVPTHRMDGENRMVPAEYRIRELKGEAAGGGAGAAAPEGGDDGGVVQAQDGLYHPDGGALAAESKRVVPDRFDLDNIHVWNAVKSRMTDISKIIEFEPTADYVKGLAKSAFFPSPEVSYKVKAYNTLYGERISEHNTRYAVKYDVSEDGKTTKITNTAMLSFSMHKIWLMLGNRETPKSAYLTLLYRPSKAFREHTGMPEQTAVWIPVINPLDGNKVNILGLLSELAPAGVSTILETLSKLDVLNMVSIPVAIGKAKARQDFGNPLNAWRVRFQVKKYGYIGMPGIPVEFSTAELTGIFLKGLVKYLTGFDIPATVSFNSSGPYVSAWGTPFQIPVLDKEWEYTSDIINTGYKGEKSTVISGTKTWVGDTEENRPEYINILLKEKDSGELLATAQVFKDRCVVWVDGEQKEEYTLSNPDGNKWAWSISGKAVSNLNEDGEYLIEEEYPKNYGHADAYTCEKNGYDLVNYWQTPARIVIRKAFDPEDAAFTRPTDMKFTVLDGNGNPVGRAEGYALSGDGTVTLTDGKDGVLLSGKEISRFRIQETFNQPADETRWSKKPDISGPVKEIKDGCLTYTFTVTNKAQLPVRIEVQKKWDGAGTLPTGVDVTLYRDKTAIRQMPLNASNGWRARSTEPDWLRFDEATGEDHVYTITEQPIPGYYTSVTEEVTTVQEEGGPVILHRFTVTNSANTVTVQGTKTWVTGDPPNPAAIPEEITVRLMADNEPALDRGGQPIEATVPNENGAWSWEFADLPAEDAAGNRIQYSVTELPVEGYDVTYDNQGYDAEHRTWTCNITNTAVPRGYQIFLFKNWEDDGDEEGVRPEKVTVTLTGGGESRSVELSEATNWIGTVSGLQKPNAAEEIAYTATEEPADNYKLPQYSSFFEDEDTGILIITNTLDDSRMNIPVAKVWENDGGSVNARPAVVTLKLYRQDAQDSETPVASVTLSAETKWKGTFSGIPKYEANNETLIPYIVREEPDPASLYSLTSVEPQVVTGENYRQGVTVTNTFSGKVVTVRKEWVNAAFVTLPNEVGFSLYRGDREYLQGTLKKAEGWTAVFGVPKADADGKAYAYSVMEADIPNCAAEYPESVTDEQGNVTLTVINTVRGVEIPVTKEWEGDENDRYGNRPESVTLNLYAGSGENAVPVDSVTLTADTGWTGAFQNHPLYRETLLNNPATATPINYSVKEADVPGYTSSATRMIGDNQIPSFTVTNTLETRTITVQKVWDDGNDRLQIRPAKVDIALTDGDKVILNATLSAAAEDNHPPWSRTLTVPKRIGGQEATYEVREKEDDIPAAYRSTVSGTAETGFTVTNTLLSDKVDIKVTKEWVNERPEYPAITLRLMSDEEKEGEYREVDSWTLNGNPNWSHVFKKKPRFAENGRVIGYDLTEDSLPGYGKPVVVDMEYEFIIYNWEYEETSRMVVEKQWEDNNNSDGVRPDRVTVELMRNGEPTGKTTELSEETLWFGTFPELERTDNGTGEWIKYSVREVPSPGYEADTESFLEELDDPGLFYWRISNVLDPDKVFTITFDPNGGTLEGSREPVKSRHVYGEEIRVAEAPVREGYQFLYWKGSEYNPGDRYRVTGDHTFTAQWKREGGLDYRFTFTKKWDGVSPEEIDWILYNPDGSVRHKKFNKKMISETEWQYEAWFAADQDYYIVENVPEGFSAHYENVGIHAGETDRCYNGGTIVNYRIPRTGDKRPLMLWGICILLGTAGLSLAVYRFIRRGRRGGRKP